MKRLLLINIIFVIILLSLTITIVYNYYREIKTCFYKNRDSVNDKMIHVDELDYDIEEIPNFISYEECDKIIEMSKSKLVPSLVYTGNKDLFITENRKSNQCWLDESTSKIPEDIIFLKKISDKIKDYTNTHNKYHEQFQVVNYGHGGFFIPHHDACDGNISYCERMNKNNGPRYITLMIYLNDNFEGGETIFPSINKKIKPEKGKAVIFRNVNAKGNIIKQSLHGGEPVKSGEKWIFNRWIHIK